MVQIDYRSFLDKDINDFYLYKKEIQNAINGSTGIISEVSVENKENIFYMFCFCLSVAQSKMVKANEAIQYLKKINFYSEKIDNKQISNILHRKVRFHNVKSSNINLMKSHFESTFEKLKYFWLLYSSPTADRRSILVDCRNWLSDSIKGFSMKASSHLMRNVGFMGLAIIDVHVLKSLFERNIIDSYKSPHNKNKYNEIENLYLNYAKELNVSSEELDFIFQKQRTGIVFK